MNKYDLYECYVIYGKKTHRLFELHIHLKKDDTNCTNLLRSLGGIGSEDRDKEIYLNILNNEHKNGIT